MMYEKLMSFIVIFQIVSGVVSEILIGVANTT
jgi:hypothetical protein